MTDEQIQEIGRAMTDAVNASAEAISKIANAFWLSPEELGKISRAFQAGATAGQTYREQIKDDAKRST